MFKYLILAIYDTVKYVYIATDDEKLCKKYIMKTLQFWIFGSKFQ